MQWKVDRVNQWLALAAHLGVIGGIIFLAIEIRQSNRIAISANEVDVRNSYAELNRSIYTNRDFAELLAKCLLPDAKLTDAEAEMISAFVYTSLNIWQAIEISYNNGMLPKQTFDEVEEDIRGYVRYYPAMRSIWRQTIDDYPSSYGTGVYRMVDQALKEAGQ